MKSLLRALGTLWQDFSEVVLPPGSQWALGLLLALGGWQVGLNAPYAISDVLLIGGAVTRILSGEMLGTALPSLLQGFIYGEDPSLGASVTTLALLALLLLTLGGWAMAALRVTSGSAVDDQTFEQGLGANWRMMTYYALMGLVLGVVVASGCSMGVFFLREALWGLPAPFAFWGYGLLALTGLFGVWFGATMLMGGFVAIAEPKTPFFSLYSKGLSIFQRGHGASTLCGLVLLGLLWDGLKWGISYALLPWPVMGAFMLGLQALGDGVFLIYSLVALGYVYATGVLKPRT